MKKTRIFAAILAVMMVVGIMPMMQVFATEDVASVITYESIEEVLKMDVVEEREELTYTFGEGFDGTDRAGVFTNASITGDVEQTADGMVFLTNETTTIWYASPSTTNLYKSGTATIISMKFTEDNDKLLIQFNNPSGGRTYITVKTTGVTATGSRLDEESGETVDDSGYSAEYAFGTEAFDLMYLPSDDGHKVLVKNAENKWQLLLDVIGYKSGGTSGFLSLTAGSGTDGAVIKSIVTYGKRTKFDSIKEIMGSKDASNWPYSKEYTGTTKPEEVDVTAGEVNYTADGIVFPASTAATVVIKPESDHWSNVNTTVLKGKFSVGSATEKMFILANTPNSGFRHYLTLYPTYLTTNTSGGRADFNFGTDWFELAIYSYEGSHDIYVKNASTDGKWKFLIANTYRANAQSNFSIQSYATNTGTFILQSLDVYKNDKTYDSIEEIMGGDVVSSYSFDFDDDFDASIMAKSSAVMTDGLDCTDQYGIDLNDGAWNFNAYKAKNWSPLNGNLPGETYIPQALYFKIKLNTADAECTLTAGAPGADGRLYRGLKVGTKIEERSAETIPTNVSVFVDTDWMEHLIVPAETENGGDCHYVKSATQTNNKWIKVIETTHYRDAGTAKTGIGVNFSQADACIKSLRTYQLATKDADAKPANATLLYHDANLDSEITYPNMTVTNGNFETPGVLSFPATKAETYGKYSLNYAGIPVGGYAEFKTSSNGTIIMNFSDGVKTVTLNTFKPYMGVEGSTDKTYLIGEGNNASRIWRVLRTETGYTFYSKVDGDGGWQKLAENVGSDATDDNTPKMNLTFRTHADGTTEGSGTLDYMKIYGPAREDLLIVTDGIGTKELKEGDTLGYGNGLRPIVNAESGKVLVATYQKGRLIRFTMKDVSELTVDGTMSVIKEGGDTIKVFLWKSVDGKMTNLTKALALTYPKTAE